MKTSAFTLLEITITLGLIAVMLIPMTTLLVSQDRERRIEQKEVAALQWASSMMEEIRTKDFEDLSMPPHSPSSSFGLRDTASEITANRSTWTDIDDYNGLVLTSNVGTLNVSVKYCSSVTAATARTITMLDVTSDCKWVSVNVQFGGQYSADLVTLVPNFYNPP
jgi:type II secretory pathway pseudopilin PulG